MQAVAAELAKPVTVPNPVEDLYVKATPYERVTTYLQYDILQDKAKNVLFARILDLDLSIVEKLPSFLMMLSKLDERYAKYSDAGAVAARAKLKALKYEDKADFEKFLRLFETRLAESRHCGNEITDRDAMYDLVTAIGPTYMECIGQMKNEPIHDQRFDVFLLKVREKYQLTCLFANPSSGTEQRKDSRQNDQRDTGNRNKKHRSPDRKRENRGKPCCFICNEYDHKARFCPQNQSPKEDRFNNDLSSKSSNNDSKPNQGKVVPNWNKFVNPKKKNNDDGKVHAMCALIDTSILLENEISSDPDNFSTSEEQEMFSSNVEEEMAMDSGAQKHMINKLEYLQNAIELKVPIPVSCAGNQVLSATHIGKIKATVKNKFGKPSPIELINVLYVPGLRFNLMSEDRITQYDEYNLIFSAKFVDVIDMSTNDIVFSGFTRNNMKWIPIQIRTLSSVVMATTIHNAATGLLNKNETALLWHRRLGHRSAQNVKKTSTIVNGIPDLRIRADQFCKCKTCEFAKSTRSTHNGERERPTRKLEKLTSDILDPSVKGFDGNAYIVSFNDPFTGYTRLYAIKNKSEVAIKFAGYHKYLCNKFPNDPVSEIVTDNAKEYTEGDFSDYCTAAGIIRDSGNAHSPELDGISERKNRTVIELIRAMLEDAGMELSMWPLVLNAVEYILNRVHTKGNVSGITPYEALYGKKPDLSNLRVFGNVVLMHLPKEARKQEATKQRKKAKKKNEKFEEVQVKLGRIAKEMILIGYRTTGYELLDVKTMKTVTSGDIKCYEDENYKVLKERLTLEENRIPVENTERGKVDDPKNQDNQTLLPSDIIHRDHTYACLVFHCSNYSSRSIDTNLGDFIPRTYEEAQNSPYSDSWNQAIISEFQSHFENNTWNVIERRPYMKLLPTKWVFTLKYNDHGDEIPKARLVARGDRDENKYLNNEIYAAVCPLDIIRLLFSIAARYDLPIYSMDISTAYLYGKVDSSDLFLRIPKGLDLDPNRYVCQLNSAIYGLRISSKKWSDRLQDVILEIGLKKSKAERCVYYYFRENTITILATYVDDILVVSNDDLKISHIQEVFRKHFKFKIVKNPNRFLGLEISRENGIIRLHQRQYIEKMARMFSFTEGREETTPMEKGLKLDVLETKKEDSEFRGMIGALSYVARHSRPDIWYAVNELSHHQGHVSNDVKKYVRRIGRYLYHTSHFMLEYRSDSEKILECFIDAAHANEPQSYSTTGFIIRHFGNPISWSTKQQSIVTSSSTAAEVVAVTDSFDDLLTIRYFIKEIEGNDTPAVIYEDNTSAYKSLDGGNTKRMRFIFIKANQVRDAVEKNEVILQTIEGKNQLADALTKSLGINLHKKFCENMFYQDENRNE